MADNRRLHTVARNGESLNLLVGGNRALDKAVTRAVAQSPGRDRAKADRVANIIHKRGGTVGEKNSHGNDPRDIPG